MVVNLPLLTAGIVEAAAANEDRTPPNWMLRAINAAIAEIPGDVLECCLEVAVQPLFDAEDDADQKALATEYVKSLKQLPWDLDHQIHVLQEFISGDSGLVNVGEAFQVEGVPLKRRVSPVTPKHP